MALKDEQVDEVIDSVLETLSVHFPTEEYSTAEYQDVLRRLSDTIATEMRANAETMERDAGRLR